MDSDLLTRLALELGVALEITTDGEELREAWPEAVQALWETKATLASRGLPVPEPVAMVVASARRAGWTEELRAA